MATPAIFILVAYLLGSISSAVLVCKLFGLPDPRLKGSKNPGATNVMRLGGKIPAVITLIGDAVKCVIPVLCAVAYGLEQWVGWVALGAFLGHLFPIFFGFKGGKGVATFLGALFALHWPLGFWFAGLWFMVAVTFRYSSLAALVASLVMPILCYIGHLHSLVLPVALMVACILVRHKTNIQKLWKGQESKIGQSA